MEMFSTGSIKRQKSFSSLVVFLQQLEPRRPQLCPRAGGWNSHGELQKRPKAAVKENILCLRGNGAQGEILADATESPKVLQHWRAANSVSPSD